MDRPLEGYARLPEDLLRELLQGTAEVVNTVERLLAPAIDSRGDLRSHLDRLGLVHRFGEQPTRSLCGVDGGFVVERTAAVDVLLSVAVGVEGLSATTTKWDSTQYQWWAQARPHDQQSDRLTRGVMVAQELAILAAAPHEFRILDGSHLTLVIQLNSSLSSFSDEIRAEARRVWERLDTVSALREASDDASIVAMPKYDSSRTVTTLLERELGQELPGDDKHLMTLLLEPGERTSLQSVPVDPWSRLHFNPGGRAEEDIAAHMSEAIRALKARQLRYFYVKPDMESPAFRVEVKPALSDDDVDAFCCTIREQITGPFVREPYPQYLADVMAKSVGLGLSALQSAAQLSLASRGRADLSELLVRSYRSEGV